MKILSLETSCDETSASIVEKNNNGIFVISNVTASSLLQHAKTGGIIPENAAREQVKFIIPVIIEALIGKNEMWSQKEKFIKANEILKKEIDAIAVTIGPGLIGSLLVGVETAKTFSYVFNKPIIPVNHLLGHIYANFINDNSKLKLDAERYQLNTPSFPFIGLIVSGGHTDLLYFKNHGDFKWLGGTRDDASGEAMDKLARILGLCYPGGPEIEKRAKMGKPDSRFIFKSPMIDSNDFDFSFSGLKTQVPREIAKIKQTGHPELACPEFNRRISGSFETLNNETINNICFSIQKAVVDVLVKKTIKAAKKYKISTIVLGGGVSANQTLRNQVELDARRYLPDAKIFYPQIKYCSDNAAMAGAYALLNYKPIPWQKINSKPELYFD